MAKEEEVVDEGVPPKKKKLLLMVVGVVGLVVLAGGGAAVYLLMTPPADGDTAKAAVKQEEGPPIYEKLDTFTVNLADHESYLQVEIALKVTDAKVQERIKLYMPEVRDALLRLLSSKSAAELAGSEGKERLAGEIQLQVNEVLGARDSAKGVKGVLFTSFIIQ